MCARLIPCASMKRITARENQAAARPQPPRAERVQPRELALAKLEPGRGVGPDDHVGVPLGGGGDLAAGLVELDRPTHPEVVELDAIAGAEAGIGSEVAL